MTDSPGPLLPGTSPCVDREADGREIWREKIEGAKTIRKFDLENNRVSVSFKEAGSSR